MRDKLKKLALVFMALCLLTTVAAPVQVKAADKVALDETKLTLMVGDTAWLTLNNVPWDDRKSVTWSSSNEAVTTVVEAWRQYWNNSAVCKIHVKNKGTAKITAQYKNKKYTCTVKVKKFALSNTEGKNEKEVKALKTIIKEQNLKGAQLPTDLEYSSSWGDATYDWDEKGNLIGIDWGGSNLQGSLSLKAFKSLEIFYCYGNDGLSSLDVSKNTALIALHCESNQLSSLDVSKNTALESLYCSNNQLSSLDMSKNTALTALYCDNNQLSSLDVNKNKALIKLYCENNQLSSLDVSKNKALIKLYCENNQLSSLDVSKCTALEYLRCSYNQLSSLDLSKNKTLTELYCYKNELSSLDLSKNKALTYLWCDDNVKVTGYSGNRE